MSETFVLNGVPIFSTGRWNNDEYTEADLDHMIAAYNQVGFKPPIKLGHDPSQPLAKSDGMPAIGWVTNLRRVGKQLYADLQNLPKKVYEAIKRKNYDRVSAEVYWDYNEGSGKVYPRVLKALSLLGAEIPAVTSLAALEGLYDASGHAFKRYDLFFPSEQVPISPMMQGEEKKKDRSLVDYRRGGEDLHREKRESYCGSCKFFCGMFDPDGKQISISCCALVLGDVASNMLCDLHEYAEPFAVANMSMDQKVYMIEKRGKKWVLVSKTTGEVLGEHETEGDAMAQERAIQAGKSKKKESMMMAEQQSVEETDPGEAAGGSEEDTMSVEQDAKIAELTAKLSAQEAQNATLQGQIMELSDKVAEFSAKLPAAEARAAELEAEKAELAEQKRKADKEAWLSAQTTEGNLKILPVELPIVEHVYDQLESGGLKVYTTADGTEIDTLSAFKSLFESRKPGTMLFTELSQGRGTETAGEPDAGKTGIMSISDARLEATRRAKEYIAQKPGATFKEALSHVYSADPDLKSKAAGVTPQGEAKAEAGQDRMVSLFRK
jgi:hypothetical protein